MWLQLLGGILFGHLMITLIKGDYPVHIPTCLAVLWVSQLACIGYLLNTLEQVVDETEQAADQTVRALNQRGSDEK